MRIARSLLVLCSVAVVACSSPDPPRTTRKPTVGERNRREPSTEDLTEDESDEPTPEENDPPQAPLDSDGDGVPDTEDCDPTLPSVGRRFLEDTLAIDKGHFANADGFPAASWLYDGGYRQDRLADASDAAVFVNQPSIKDVLVEVRVASTEITGAITPPLRQIFVLVGTTINAGQFDALGCGIEVDGTQSPEQKTSVVRLSGPATNVTTTVEDRVNRPAVQVNEELTIQARLSKGVLTCMVTQGEGGAATTTIATANGVGVVTGSVGFFTRQTKALFKQARICELR